MDKCNVLNGRQKYSPNNRNSINMYVSRYNRKNTPEKWQQYIKDTFLDADLIIKAINDNNGMLPMDFSTESPSENIPTKPIITDEETVSDVKNEFIRRNSFGQHKALIAKFKKDIIKNCILEIDDNGNVKMVKRGANSVIEGVNLINYNIFMYKMGLVKAIGKVTGVNYNTESHNTEQITETILKAINDFNGVPEQKNNLDYINALNAYITLKCFDSLLADNIDFLESNVRPGVHALNQYTFVEPKSTQRKDWREDRANIKDATSKMQKLILSYMPIISKDSNGKEYINWNYSIDSDGGGFEAVVNRFKSWVYRNNLLNNEEYKKFLLKDNPDFERLFDDFIQKDFDGVTSGFVLDRARAIKKFIFSHDSKLRQDLKEMFENQLYKTTKQLYSCYGVNSINKYLEQFTLEERLINSQSMNVSMIVKSMTSVYRKSVENSFGNPTDAKASKSRYNEVLERYKMEFAGDDLIIKHDAFGDHVVTIHVEPGNKMCTTKISGIEKMSREQLDKFNEDTIPLIREFLQMAIPANWKEALITSMGGNANKRNNKYEDTTLISKYAPALAIVCSAVEGGLNTENNFNDSERYDFKAAKYSDMWAPLSQFLSIAYGSDSVTTLKNQSGNNVPNSGLTYKCAELSELIAQLNAEESKVNAKNPIYNSVAGQTDGKVAVGTPVIRTDVKYRDKTATSSKLSTQELAYLSIIPDFLGKIYKNTLYPGKADTSKFANILLQYTTLSDKSTHFMVPIELGNMMITKGDAVVSALDIVKSICQRENDSDDANLARNSIFEAMTNYRRHRINTQMSSLVKDYSIAFPEWNLNLKEIPGSINKIRSQVAKWSKSDIASARKRFAKNGLKFIDEIHIAKHPKVVQNGKRIDVFSGDYDLNETMLYHYEIYNNENKTEDRYAFALAKTLIELSKNDVDIFDDGSVSWTQLGVDYKEKWINENSQSIVAGKVWRGKTFIDPGTAVLTGNENYSINKKGQIEIRDEFSNDLLYIFELNPAVEAWCLMNMYYANAYKDLSLGDCYAQDYKYTASLGDFNIENTDSGQRYVPNKAFNLHSEANREGAGFKRTVIEGATHHPFHFGNTYGASRYINMSVMEDRVGEIWNLIGVKDLHHKVNDGSGLASIYQAIFENWSLKDAHVGLDKKTIFGNIDPKYGNEEILKWAVYAITNHRRRMSWRSEVRLQNIFEKMHSQKIDSANIDYSDYYDVDGRIVYDREKGAEPLTYGKSLYFKDEDGLIQKPGDNGEYIPGRHFKILTIVNDNNGNAIRMLQEVREDGTAIGETFRDVVKVDTISDLDNVFGGAWAETMTENGLDYTDDNNYIVANIICRGGFKDKFTSYIVNKSAVKAGAANVNPVSSWNDAEPLMTMRMSLAFGGVQMDAEHDVDMSEVTEMSQMISALIQNGMLTDLVNRIYGDIGKVALAGIADINNALTSGDKDKIYRIIGKALMDSISIEKGRSSMGLAESFIVKASQYLKESNIKYRIPFSSGNINSKYIATVISDINKKGIRRKYAGLAGVLTPSHDMIQFYRIGNNTYMFDELNRMLLNDPMVTIPGSRYRRKYTNELGEEKTWTNDNLFNDIGYAYDGDRRIPLNPFIVGINNFEANIEDTILYRKKGSNEDFDEVRIDSWEKLDEIHNLKSNDEWEFFRWEIKPRNLAQADTQISVSIAHDGIIENRRISMYDLDVSRASFYIQEEFRENVEDNGRIRLVAKDYSKFKNSKKYEVVRAALIKSGVIGIADSVGDVIDVSMSAVIKSLQRKLEKELTNLSDGKNILERQVCLPYGDITVNNVEFKPSEIITSRVNGKEFGLNMKDNISDVLREKEDFFKRKLRNKYNLPSKDVLPRTAFDMMLTDDEGNKALVVIGEQDKLMNRFGDKVWIKTNSEYYSFDGKIYKGQKEICNDDGKISFNIVGTVTGETYDVITVDSAERINELMDENDVYTNIEYNYLPSNYTELLNHRFDNIIVNGEILPGNSFNLYDRDFNSRKFKELEFSGDLFDALPVETRSIIDAAVNEFESELNENYSSSKRRQAILAYKNKLIADQYCRLLNNDRDYNVDKKINNLASQQYKSFVEQLDCVGARIPTQSMQSFMAMRIVGYSHSSVNEVYVPRSQTFFQGSDYDIDKLYILGYSITKDGILQSLSKAQGDLTPEQAIQLPAPDGKTYVQAKPIGKIARREFARLASGLNNETEFNEAKTIDINDLVDARAYKRPGLKLRSTDQNRKLDTIAFFIKEKPNSRFELSKDSDDYYILSFIGDERGIHLKDAERDILYKTIIDALPVGAKLVMRNAVPEYAVSLFTNLSDYDFFEPINDAPPTFTCFSYDTKFTDSENVFNYINPETNEIQSGVEDSIWTEIIPVLIKKSNISAFSFENYDNFDFMNNVLNSGITQVYFNESNNNIVTTRDAFLDKVETFLFGKNFNKTNAWASILAEYNEAKNKDKYGFKLSDLEEVVSVEDYDTRFNAWNRFLSNLDTNWSALSDIEKSKLKSIHSKLKLLNRHSHSKFKGYRREAAIRNLVVANTLKATRDPRVQIASMNPINMDAQQKAARESILANEEKLYVLDCPTTKFKMQEQNMVGRECIGISAVMNKNFFAASYYCNIMIEEIAQDILDGEWDKVFGKLEVITFHHEGEITSLANLNFEPIYKALDKVKERNNGEFPPIEYSEKVAYFVSENMPEGTLESLQNLIKLIDDKCNRIDAADSISGLISASTDNAKELILAKINADQTFIDMYGHLIMCGHAFGDVANFMQQKEMLVAARLVKSNIFDSITRNLSLESVINFILGTSQLGNINNKEFNNILFAWNKVSEKNEYGKVDGNTKLIDNEACFVLKLLYEIDENGKLKRDKNGHLKERKNKLKFKTTIPANAFKNSTDNSSIKVDDLGEAREVEIDKTFIDAFFNVVPNGNKYVLSSVAKILRAEFNNLFVASPEAINILIAHLKYLRSQIKSTKRFENYEDMIDGDDELFATADYYEDQEFLEEDDYGEYDSVENDYRERALVKSEDPTVIKPGALTKENYSELIRYAEKYLKLKSKLINEVGDFDYSVLEEVMTRILPATEEQRILGRMLSVNQGLKTNTYDVYSFRKTIENFINKRYTDDEQKPFDLMRFILDDDERQLQIDQYEKVKSKLNILAVISSPKHFRTMFDMMATAISLTEQSARNRLQNKFADSILNDGKKKLNRAEFGNLDKYITQLFIFNWLKTTNYEFAVHTGEWYYSGYNRYSAMKVGESNSITFDLKNADNIATFRIWMNTVVFPALIKSIKGNAFIDSLTYHSVKGMNNKPLDVYRFPFNPMEVTLNPVSEASWNNIVHDFNDIAKTNLRDLGLDSNMNVMDAVYLYSLVTFGDSFSKSSMTKVFEDVNLKYDDTAVNSYNEFLSNLDASEDELKALGDYNEIDLLYNVIGKNSNKKLMATVDHGELADELTLRFKDGDNYDMTSCEIPTNLPSDYTFLLPGQQGLLIDDGDEWRNDAVPYAGAYSTKINRYSIDSKEVIDAITEQLIEMIKDSGSENMVVQIYNDELDKCFDGSLASLDQYFKINTEEELKRLKSAKAFIKNGKVYINMSNASAGSALHEYMHIVAAGLKFNKDENTRKAYYELLEKAQDSYKRLYPKEYKNMLKLYSELDGSDFNEELLVNLIEKVFIKQVDETLKQSFNEDVENIIKRIVSDIFGVKYDSTRSIYTHDDRPTSLNELNMSRLSMTSLSGILKFFNSNLFSFTKSNFGMDSVKDNQKMRALKKRLISEGILKYKDCK